MDKVLLIFLSLFSVTVNAVSMENRVFSLNATQIDVDTGIIKAQDHVLLRIKSLDDISKLTNQSNVVLSELTDQRKMLNITLSDGWKMKGRVLAISINDRGVIIESDELYFFKEQLIVQNL